MTLTNSQQAGSGKANSQIIGNKSNVSQNINNNNTNGKDYFFTITSSPSS